VVFSDQKKNFHKIIEENNVLVGMKWKRQYVQFRPHLVKETQVQRLLQHRTNNKDPLEQLKLG
jgi:hypothetical protein